MFYRVMATLNLSQGLLAYYPFTGNANDASGNGHNGTVSGAILTTDEFGSADSAYSFDGNNDYIDTFSVNSQTTLTVCAWARLERESSDTAMAIVTGDNGGFDRGLHVHRDGVADTNLMEISVNIGLPSGGEARTGVYVPYGIWQHYALEYTANNIHLFLNGAHVWSYGSAASGWNEGTWHIGNNQFDGWHFKGSIDEVRFYNRALFAYELRALSGDASTALLAYYPFTGNANDASGNGHNGTVSGAILTTDEFGKTNSAYYFDGTNDYIDTLSVNSQTTLTVCAWATLEKGSSDTAMAIVAGDNGEFDRGLQVHRDGVADTNVMEISVNIGLPSSGEARTGVYVPYGSWQHFALEYTTNNIHLFLNGVHVWSYGSAATQWNEGTWHIGNNQFDGWHFKGAIDEVRFYNRALSSGDILVSMWH